MEVISRAEEYLNYALKNQENYPDPISRMDYYLLSVAQEVRSGGADPATITEAVNSYLTENPVQAMSDSDIAASVNKSINDGSINVMSEVEDRSITEDKLSDDVFYNAYVITDNQGMTPYINFNFDTYNSATTYNYRVTCTVTATNDIDISGCAGVNANNAMTEKNGITKLAAGATTELEYTATNTNKYTHFRFVNNSANAIMNLIIEDLKVYVNDIEIQLINPTSKFGTIKKYFLKGKLPNKQYVDDSVKGLEDKIDFSVIKDYSQELSRAVSKNQLKNLELAYSLDFTKIDSNFNYTTSQISDGVLNLASNKSINDKRYPSLDVFKEVVKFNVADLTTVFGHYNYTRKAFVVDCTNNKLKLCTTDLSTIQSTDKEIDIPFTIDTDTIYTLTTLKNGTYISTTLYNEATGQSVMLESRTNYMTGYGQYGIKSYSGTTYISEYKLYLPLISKNPTWFFGGDSITQGVGVSDISNRWCSRILENYCDGDGIIWGKGNNISSELLARLKVIYDLGYNPKNVVILIGTNDTKDTTDGYTTWHQNIDSIIELVEQHNGIPILCVPPLKSDTTMNNIIFQMRDYLLSKPYKVIRMDLATSVDELGAEQDTTLFNSDHVHPNDAGTLKMYERFLLDIGDGVSVEDEKENANNIKFDNTASGLTATDVASAINELKTLIDNLKTS